MPPLQVCLAPGADLPGFRRALRQLIASGTSPDDVTWGTCTAPDLFGSPLASAAPPVTLPRAVGELIELAVCHREPERYALLYSLAWRVMAGERDLLDVASDPLVHRLERMRKTIRRDLHKMHAFVRFRRLDAPQGGERFVAWFEPDHYILEATAGFFVERFRSLDWTILTPIGSLHWDRMALTFGPAATRDQAPNGDSFEAGWRGYYESTFNPARVNPSAMRSEMPKKYWRNLPEAAAIPDLLRTAPERARQMLARGPVMPNKRTPQKAVDALADQAPRTLADLNRVILASEPLVPGATRAVLGEGPSGAGIAFVGEQPGDQEDLQGRPFVGPAGQMLDRALQEAGIDRSATYLTNAVKHFKFVQRGKRRLHQRPTVGEVKHYKWWLRTELDLVAPRVIVALGATATFALAGRALPVTQHRGATHFDSRQGYITVHPSYLLRLPNPDDRRKEFEAFVADLVCIKSLAA